MAKEKVKRTVIVRIEGAPEHVQEFVDVKQYAQLHAQTFAERVAVGGLWVKGVFYPPHRVREVEVRGE